MSVLMKNMIKICCIKLPPPPNVKTGFAPLNTVMSTIKI